MINVANYVVELRLDGTLIGDIRPHAQNLNWARRRTKIGVDTISFTVNDTEFARWCAERNTTIAAILKPLALDCRIIRNGIPVVGGYLATMPSYQPKGNTATLELKFDGYINYLSRVYLEPGSSFTGRMGQVIQQWIQIAEQRASAAGKAFGFSQGSVQVMKSIQVGYQDYKDIKSAIVDRCDNKEGAGPFEFYCQPDRTFDVIVDSNFGDEIADYIIEYPTMLNAVSATSISAREVTGFASMVRGVGAMTINDDGTSEPATYNEQLNRQAVIDYGYAEKVFQQSSVSRTETLIQNVAAELASCSTMEWQPEISLTGRTVNPTPSGERKIWIGDTITIQNHQDLTGMTSGKFRVNALEVKVDATGAEEIVPTISKNEDVNTNSFAKEFVRLENELNLKSGNEQYCILA